MYRILIENLEFEAIIGILPEEREKIQKVVVNAEIEYKNKNEFIDYAEVCSILEKLMIEKKFMLIEDALEAIEYTLIKKYPQMRSLKLKIQKPEILRNALVGVEILRKY
ncbi:dihydroneopterin aldolase [Nautilia sp.]